MTDNVTLPGTGAIVATDNTTEGQIQLVKLVDGTADSIARIPGDATFGFAVDLKRGVALALDATTLAALETITIGSLPAVALDAATLAALESITVVDGGGTISIDDGGGSITVDGSVTISDGSGPVTVDGTIAATQSGTWNVTNISGAITLPTGAATSALQTTGNTSVGNIDTKTPALGQGLMAASSPVAIASNQSAIPASQSGTWNIATVTAVTGLTNALPAGTNNIGDVDVLTLPALPAGTNNIGDVDVLTLPSLPAGANTIGNIANVSGTVSLPTGAATSALQTTGNTSVGNIDTKTPALGQAAMAASSPVVIASNQSAIPASQSGTWNIGTVTAVTGLTNALPAGTNNIGDVDVLTLPALPAGTNNIGDVDVLTLPSLPAGANAIGKLAANSGVDIGDIDVTSILPGTGATNLGKVEDAAHTTGDVGVMALGVRNTGRSAFTNTTADYSPISVNDLGDIYATLPGFVSTANSTTATLGAAATFTGTAEDVTGYAGISVNVKASHSSDGVGLKLQWSSDATNWDVTEEYRIVGGATRSIHTPIKGAFFRLTYTNGDTAQSSFRLQTIYRSVAFQPDVLVKGELPPGVRDNLGGAFEPEHYDDFNRGATAASQWGLGMAPTGGVWQTTGPDFAATNINATGYFNLGGVGAGGKTCYAYQFLNSPVARHGGIIRMTTGSGAVASGDCVLICGSAATIASWVHCQSTLTGWTIDVIDAAGGFVTLLSGSYGVALTLDRDYYVQVTIQGDTVIFEAADGVTYRIADARIQAFAGNMAMIELLSTGASVREPMWRRHWAFTRKQAAQVTAKRAMHVAIADNIPSKATYRVTARSLAPALVASTLKTILAMSHAATVNVNVYLRKVTATISGNSAAGVLSLEMYRLTSAGTGGAAITPMPTNSGDAAATTSVMSLPTGGAAMSGVAFISQTYNLAVVVANADSSKLNQLVLYEYQSGNDSKPITIRRNILEGIGVALFHTGVTPTVTITLELEFSEE